MRSAVRQVFKRALQAIPSKRLLWRGPADRRRVALTFDDGPDDLTPRYLELLDRHAAPATFFILGASIPNRRHLIQAYLRGGHQLGGHGYVHTRFTRLTPGKLRDQLDRTAAEIGPLPEAWVRPPHGSLGPIDLATMLASGYTVGMWSLDSRDCVSSSPADIAARCAPDRVSPGEVLLFHEGQEQTLAALPEIIGRLRDDGYELVTMSDLFAR